MENQTPALPLQALVQGKTRRSPYPPSLSKTPAKIMDPATGAST